jgi:hypothetical protein
LSANETFLAGYDDVAIRAVSDPADHDAPLPGERFVGG